MSNFHVLGVGGSTRVGSSTEVLLRSVLDLAAERGASTTLLSGADLILPAFEPDMKLPPTAVQLTDEFRRADAVVIGSPAYHGTVSGLVKNALDYAELLRDDDRAYFDSLPIGCVVTAHGWQAAVNTLAGLRQIAHALRGWPTPIGIAVNVADGRVIVDGRIIDPKVQDSVERLTRQLFVFKQHSVYADKEMAQGDRREDEQLATASVGVKGTESGVPVAPRTYRPAGSVMNW